MKASSRTRRPNLTDPVAVAIESHLRTVQAHGGGELRVDATADGCTVAFGQSSASGQDYEIALVRLARVLLDDAQFTKALLDALHGPLPAIATGDSPNPASPIARRGRNRTPGKRFRV